jgi:hypothetical protein
MTSCTRRAPLHPDAEEARLPLRARRFRHGFSSFTHLRHLPVDFVKIEGSFVEGMAGSSSTTRWSARSRSLRNR